MNAGCRHVVVTLLLASCNAPIVFDAQTIGADASVEGTAIDAPSRADAPEGGFVRLCSSDPDCRLPSLHCDTDSHTCVPCLNDTHCVQVGLRRCDLALHRCIECGSAMASCCGRK